MQKEFNKERWIKYLIITSTLTVACVGFFVFRLLAGNVLSRLSQAIGAVLLPFVIAFFLSFIIEPLSRMIHEKLKIPKMASAIISIFMGIVLILGILMIAIVFIMTQLGSILSSLIQVIDMELFSNMLESLYEAINLYISEHSIQSLLEQISNNGLSIDKVISLIGAVFVSLSSVLSTLIGFIFVIILTPVFLYYLITQKSYIFSGIARIFPKHIKPHAEALGIRSDAVIKKYLVGQGIMMAFIALYNIIALGLLAFFVPEFNIEHVIMFALLMGLMNIIPYIGAWIGITAPIVFLLTKCLTYQQNDTNMPIFLIAMVMIIVIHLIEQVLESAIVQPNVYGKQVHIHPLIVLSSLLFFGGLFGFAGILLAVPIAGTIKASVTYIAEVRNEQAQRAELEKAAKQQKEEQKKKPLKKIKNKD